MSTMARVVAAEEQAYLARLTQGLSRVALDAQLAENLPMHMGRSAKPLSTWAADVEKKVVKAVKEEGLAKQHATTIVALLTDKHQLGAAVRALRNDERAWRAFQDAFPLWARNRNQITQMIEAATRGKPEASTALRLMVMTDQGSALHAIFRAMMQIERKGGPANLVGAANRNGMLNGFAEQAMRAPGASTETAVLRQLLMAISRTAGESTPSQQLAAWRHVIEMPGFSESARAQARLLLKRTEDAVAKGESPAAERLLPLLDDFLRSSV